MIQKFKIKHISKILASHQIYCDYYLQNLLQRKNEGFTPQKKVDLEARRAIQLNKLFFEIKNSRDQNHVYLVSKKTANSFDIILRIEKNAKLV